MSVSQSTANLKLAHDLLTQEQNNLILTALELAEKQLHDFANSPDFQTKMQLNFGVQVDITEIQKDWQNEDFSIIPNIQVRLETELNGAMGAYAQATNTIYLSQDFLNQNTANVGSITSVLLEEIGHAVDAKINTVDTPGEEGAIFAGLVQGKTFEPDQFQELKAKNDTATINLDGQILQIEKATTGFVSGGFEGSQKTIKLDSKGGGTVKYEYQMFTIPDQLILRYEGKEILNTGFVSGGKTGIVSIPQGKSDELQVILATNDSGTAWNYNITTSRKPILILPGIGGSFVNPNNYDRWVLNRGLNPNELVIDPLVHSYDDLIATLQNAGYKLGEDLFEAPYDWRLAPGPNDPSRDGIITGISAASITDNKYEYGVDYLGYWLKQASEKWQQRFPDAAPLDSVDVIAHSTGGLVTRTYIQSNAYGVTLPKIDNLIMLGVPNQGAPKAWNPINDDWNADIGYSLVMRQFANVAYQKLLQGLTIKGPTDITQATVIAQSKNSDLTSKASKEAFIDQYIPTIKALLATYTFGADVQPNQENSLLLDLNVNTGLVTDKSNVTVVFGNNVKTITSVESRTSPKKLVDLPGDKLDIYAPSVESFTEGPPGHIPTNEKWWEDIETPNSGDGTVPRQSSTYLEGKQNRGFNGVEHGKLPSDQGVQQFILETLGAKLEKGKQISTGKSGLSFGLAKNVWNFINDPVDGFLIDAQGRRLGYSQATGVLTEIPNSVWFGEQDGIGWVFGEVDSPATLELTGLGQDHYVQVSGVQGTQAGGVDSSGFLATGEQKNLNVVLTDIPQDPNTPISGGDLEISVLPNPDVLLGENFTYTINIQNKGPNNSTGVFLTEYLSNGVKFIAANASKGQVSQFNGIVSIDVGNLNSGETATATIEVSPFIAGTVTSTSNISSTVCDPNPNNDSVTLAVDVSPITPTATDLELIQTVDNSNPQIGDEINFTLTLTNKGTGTASGIKVKDILPSELDFVSYLADQGTYDSQTGLWDVGNMRDNLTRNLKLTAKVNQLGAITNTAELIAVNETDPDSTPNNNNPNEDDQSLVTLNSALGTSTLTKIADDIFTISGSAGKPKLQVNLAGSSSNLVNELGVFTVDDAQGKINGITPGETGYTQAALNKSKVIFSTIANIPNGFNINKLNSLLEFNSSDNLRFFLIKNGTIDSIKTGITSATNILFSDLSNQNIRDLGTDGFSLSWKDGSNNNADFKDLVVNIKSTNDPLPLGTNLQGKQQGEVIDLRDITQDVKVDFIVNREAAFNNFVGFYKVTDENGGIDVDGNGTVDFRPSDSGYAQAAINNRVAGIDLRVDNQGTATFTDKLLTGGSIFAPFILTNGRTVDQVINGQVDQTYFAYLGANSDKMDHIRLLGNNTFGFEDLAGGGDNDFNDVIIQAKLTV
jgi:uncharacterized repeat protein (TIGR01451 family)